MSQSTLISSMCTGTGVLSCLSTIGFVFVLLYQTSPVSSFVPVEGFEGGEVTLPCQSSNDVDTYWYKGGVNDIPILVKQISGQVIPSTDTRNVWKGDVVSLVGYDLKIKSLRESRDKGQFTCRASDETVIKVIVLARIARAAINGTSDVQLTVSSGRPITLTCVVTGDPHPAPTFTWAINNSSVTNADSKTFILNPTKFMKSIKCTAKNVYRNGTELSSGDGTAQLTVHYLGAVTIESPSSHTVEENERLTLNCTAEGNPSPTFNWIYGSPGNSVSSSSYYVIEAVQRSAAGGYTCQASNGENTRETTTEIVVQYPPDVTVIYDNSSHTLTCRADGIPNTYNFSPWEHWLNGKMIRTLNGTSTGTGSQDTLQLSTDSYENMGEYRCLVSNSIGAKQQSNKTVTFDTRAVFDQHKVSFTVGLNQSFDVFVLFYARPAHSEIEWKKSSDNQPLDDHSEEPGLVSLSLHNTDITIPGTKSILKLTDIEPTDEGNYTITVTNMVNGKSKTSTFVIYVNATYLPDPESSPIGHVGAIVGGVAGAIVVFILVIVLVVLYKRRRRAADKSGEKDEKTSVNEHLVTSARHGGFNDPRWNKPDAEIAQNDLYEPATFSTVPPQDDRPPKPARTFEHKPKPAVPTPGEKTKVNQDMEMIENTLYDSAGPAPTQTGKQKAVKKTKDKKAKQGKAKSSGPIDDTYIAMGQKGSAQNNNTPVETPPVYAAVDITKKTKKAGAANVVDEPSLNYTQVDFAKPKKKKGKKDVVKRSEPGTNYADINFNAGAPHVDDK